MPSCFLSHRLICSYLFSLGLDRFPQTTTLQKTRYGSSKSLLALLLAWNHRPRRGLLFLVCCQHLLCLTNLGHQPRFQPALPLHSFSANSLASLQYPIPPSSFLATICYQPLRHTMSTGPPTIPPGWTPEMSIFVREIFSNCEGLETVKELFFTHYPEMAKKELEVSDAWLISLRPAGWS